MLLSRKPGGHLRRCSSQTPVSLPKYDDTNDVFPEVAEEHQQHDDDVHQVDGAAVEVGVQQSVAHQDVLLAANVPEVGHHCICICICTGCPKKLQHSDFLFRSVPEVQFNISTCVSESEF